MKTRSRFLLIVAICGAGVAAASGPVYPELDELWSKAPIVALARLEAVQASEDQSDLPVRDGLVYMRVDVEFAIVRYLKGSARHREFSATTYSAEIDDAHDLPPLGDYFPAHPYLRDDVGDTSGWVVLFLKREHGRLLPYDPSYFVHFSIPGWTYDDKHEILARRNSEANKAVDPTPGTAPRNSGGSSEG